MELNQANYEALWLAYNTVFQQWFQQTPTQWESFAMRTESTTSKSVYPWLGQTTMFRKWIGDRVIQNLTIHGFSIENESFENTVGVSRDSIDDDEYGVYSPLFSQLAQDAKRHPDQLVYSLLKDGTTTLCYDGQPFFSADHPVGLQGNEVSVSNDDGGAGTPWFLIDNTRAIKPMIVQFRKDYQFVALNRPEDWRNFMAKELLYGVDARLNVGFGLWQLAHRSAQDLTTANYAAARASMMEVKSDAGAALNVNPSLLIVPPSLEEQAFEVIKTQRLANGASNPYYNSATVLVAPYLA
ncbi:Mu-like prophage major head subunit gpT family protein [Burkholderia cenocepacia]|uniref:Mu-like prophage major head subunit gpT family protein n=1 Tax=Burkholderia cenocepacia TaxID=95486 RepID=UPI001AA18983|nr:Mu-like prophage major head subunit gpT family protein [Burkholderia cenocepacia]MBO1856843.1 Mu-like prophage major head subunit gpT family protein [Burkholderia cenocepacia]